MSKGAPAQPDYQGAATSDAYSNRPNISTPWGNLGWSTSSQIDPSTGKPVTTWQGNVSLSPAEQAALDSQQAIQQNQSGLAQTVQGNAAEALGSPMDWSQFGTLGTGDDARQKAIDASYGQAASRLDPQWDQRQAATENALRNQGLDPDSAASRTAMGDFNRARTDAYSTAMNNAITTGNQAQALTFNQNLQGRQQAISEALQQRSQPLNEMEAILAGQQVSMPQFPGMNTQGSNMAGAAAQQYGANVNSYNAGQAGLQNLFNNAGAASSLFFLGL